MYIQHAEPGARRWPIDASNGAKALKVGVYFAAHVPLALLMRQYPALASVHASITILAGVYLALFGRRPARVAYVGAYICGSEVLWRMCHAQVYWELAKYGVSAIFLVSILSRRKFKAPALPLAYFALLIPSVLLTGLSLGSGTKAQDLISFNLSGPFSLMVGAWFFSHLKLSKNQVQTLFLTLIGPVLGITAIALASLESASDIRFSNNSNFAASGGFGPNQVSATLGLGAVLCMFLLLSSKSGLPLKLLLACALMLTSAQSALTFSRAGLYNAAAGIISASVFLAKDSGSRIRIVVSALLVYLFAQYLVLPRLDKITGGALTSRFSSVETTGRDTIALAELEMWKTNPVFGIGIGMGMVSYGKAAHTEFTRMLAEHGLMGIAAIFIMLVIAAKNIYRAPGSD